MELEFDKEIDAILRNPRIGRGAHVPVSPHVDADALAAFTENALPPAARLLYMEHFADCDGCRQILASTMSINSGVEELPISVAVVPVWVPWYRALFTAPALAAAMGILVIGFAGIIAYQLVQPSANEPDSGVSQITEPETERGGPFTADEMHGSMNSNMSAAVTNSNKQVASANAMAGASPPQPTAGASSNRPMPSGQTEPAEERAALTTDSEVTQSQISGLARVEPRPPAAAPKAPITLDGIDSAERKVQEDREKDLSGSFLAKRKSTERPRDAPPPAAKAGPTRSGPLQNQSRQMNNQLSDMSVTRTVGGKTFTNRNGAWYDSAYRNQATANFRRGTAEYKKLDSGLRSIADTLGGTVVVVWKSNAFRIQ